MEKRWKNQNKKDKESLSKPVNIIKKHIQKSQLTYTTNKEKNKASDNIILTENSPIASPNNSNESDKKMLELYFKILKSEYKDNTDFNKYIISVYDSEQNNIFNSEINNHYDFSLNIAKEEKEVKIHMSCMVNDNEVKIGSFIIDPKTLEDKKEFDLNGNFTLLFNKNNN